MRSNNANIGSRLKRARQRVELSQAELAERLGSDQSTISRVERGQNPRGELDAAILAFITESESQSPGADQLLEAIAKSKELKALIARIVAEL